MKTAFRFLRDVFEIYIPVLSFFAMFAAFLLQVFFRYIMRHPLTWTQEVIVMGFIWTVLFGACYTMRQRSHVKFTMIYDRFKPKPAALLRLAGNLIIAATFLILLVPSYKYAFFLGFQKTAVFRISFVYMFLPFTYFIISIVAYTVAEIVKDIQIIRGVIPDDPEHAAAEQMVMEVEQ